MRTLVNRIILPAIVGVVMLGATWTAIGLASGSWPSLFDLTGWSDEASATYAAWLILAAWAVGCGPAYLLRRVIFNRKNPLS